MPLEFVTKRNGNKQAVDWNKVDGRLNYLNSHPTQLSCNASFVADRVREMDGECGMETKYFDERAAKVAQDFAAQNPDFAILSSRISVSNHHKNTLDCFSSTMEACYRNRKLVGKRGNKRSVAAPRINAKLYKFSQLHKIRLNRMIDYSRDYRHTDFGFAALMDRYLIKRSGDKHDVEQRPQDYALERPQDMWLRVACAIHMNRNNLADDSVLDAVQETYDLLSLGFIMHATPTLYNAGTLCEQLLSCYLMGGEDSIESIGKIKADMLKLSKHSGGIGWWWPLRSSGSEVSLTNGTSGGPEPFLRGVEADMKAANQGGKRPGSAANYNDPAHPDTMRWLKLKRADAGNNIKDLFYALWLHDEFMIRVVRDELWYWVDPHEQPALYGMVGEAYSTEYRRIIEAGLYKGEPIPARDVLMEACETQAEGGMPYMLFADAINRKSNMINSMVTRCSNLCAEITIPSSSKEYGCCAISSLCLPKFVIDCDCAECHSDPEYKWVEGTVEGHQQGCNGVRRIDYDHLAYCTGVLVRNLNKITDINYYPVEEARRSQMRHRPLGIGVQGLADVFHLMKYPFESPQAQAENPRIFESIYYGGQHASMELARRDGAYETFRGDPLNNPEHPDELSPAAEGRLQFDLWGLSPKDLMGRWDWDQLKADIKEHGLRNSLITALPPTASTSHIQGNNECFEPYTDNIYVRKTLSGENLVINHHLVKDLVALGLWTTALRNKLIAERGSVQALDVPDWIKKQYKTVWEMDNRILIDMDAARGPFVDQTQSSNRFMSNPTAKRLFAMHVRCWRKGLKTGMYYLRSQSKSKPTQFSEEVKAATKPAAQEQVTSPLETVEEKTVEQEMICMLKKKNGVMCYTCQ
jgi:ribonucleoside-diphosphate reductase alpha subunit